MIRKKSRNIDSRQNDRSVSMVCLVSSGELQKLYLLETASSQTLNSLCHSHHSFTSPPTSPLTTYPSPHFYQSLLFYIILRPPCPYIT